MSLEDKIRNVIENEINEIGINVVSIKYEKENGVKPATVVWKGKTVEYEDSITGVKEGKIYDEYNTNHQQPGVLRGFTANGAGEVSNQFILTNVLDFRSGYVSNGNVKDRYKGDIFYGHTDGTAICNMPVKFNTAIDTNNYGEWISKILTSGATLKKDSDGNQIYDEDYYGNEIVSFIDVNEITKLYLPIIDDERKKLEKLVKSEMPKIKVGDYCNYKKTTKCPFISICFDKLPEKNSVLTLLDSQYGFNVDGKKTSVYDLINNGYYKISDLPDSYLTRKTNIIQKEVITTSKPYINIDKIKDGLSLIKYPIYHLDFETFPCPLPQFKGERCYTQSVFQFSLHIETEAGCDKEKDHYGFLSDSLKDHREELVKKLCSLIDKEGTVLVYNSSFEKNRLKELSLIFPEYKEKLDFINNMVFDLMDIVKGNKKLYMDLGYSEEDSRLFNFYQPSLNGSFSIKKVLPIFSDLSYQDLQVSNGVEAYSTYLKFDNLDKKDKLDAYNSLVEYCKQDTWAMVEILDKLKELSKNVK